MGSILFPASFLPINLPKKESMQIVFVNIKFIEQFRRKNREGFKLSKIKKHPNPEVFRNKDAASPETAFQQFRPL
ncbi:hypothetical protein [Gramella sp. AN32]|uniref:Uncharacterized protein n=1 Tax=Christiangramia antarctica TaxID=2058158 RepID=A0ABW5X2K6_9FLAO|nr:hypothetical protein [Gramella sp. AN32]